MFFISHRGNINGPNPEKENHPDYIKAALKAGFQTEIDVWYVNNKFILGHDKPQYETTKYFLSNNKLWCHAKNIEAVSKFASYGNLIHFFFHDTDACTLTSRGWVWAYPGQPLLSKKFIAVLPERFCLKSKEDMLLPAGGICSDYVQEYQETIKII